MITFTGLQVTVCVMCMCVCTNVLLCDLEPSIHGRWPVQAAMVTPHLPQVKEYLVLPGAPKPEKHCTSALLSTGATNMQYP